MAIRRKVLGDAHVDRDEAATTAFDAPFQELVTEAAWARVWARGTISLRERSMLTIALLEGLGNDDELALHIRATANTGATEADVMKALLSLEQSLSEITGPSFGHGDLGALDHDLIRNFATTGDPVGERIVVHRRVLDENGRPVPQTLVEVWQANAGGRYRHRKDTYLAPVDPNFGGCGRTITDAESHYFSARSSRAPIPDAIMGTRGAPRISMSRSSAGRSASALSRSFTSRAIR